QLLCKKYLGDKSIFQLTRNIGSQLWKSLLSVCQWFQWGRKVRIREGKQTRFWVYLWIGDCPLSVGFNQLYKHCRDPNILVNDVCGSGMTHIEFRRSLNDEELE